MKIWGGGLVIVGGAGRLLLKLLAFGGLMVEMQVEIVRMTMRKD